MRRQFTILCLFAVVIAGCTGGPQVGNDAVSHRHLSVMEVSDSDTPEDALNFSSMSEDQQEVFKTVVESSDGSTKIPADVDYDVWIENKYITYQNQIYEVAVAAP